MNSQCQSCGMPLKNNDTKRGTNKNNTISNLYCSFCFTDGEFNHSLGVEEFIEMLIEPMMSGATGMNEEQCRTIMQGIIPNLERWNLN